MNNKLSTSVTGCVALLLAVLVLPSCNAGSSESEAMCNVTVAAVKSFDAEVKDSRSKADEILEALNNEQKEPGRGEKIQPYCDRATEVKKVADSFFSYIDGVLASIAHAGQYPVNEPEKSKMPHTVRILLDTAYAKMMAMQYPADTGSYNTKLKGERFLHDFRDTAGWEDRMFGKGVTKCMVVMNLSRIKSTVAAMEHFHIARLYEHAMSGCRFKFSPVDAVAIPRSAYLFPGDKSDANIFLFNSNWLEETGQRIKEITVDGRKVRVVNSMGHYEFTETIPGLHAHYGRLTVEGEGDMRRSYDFKWENFVFTPAVHVAYDKPIILEAGREETVTITTEYVFPKDIIVSLSRGSISDKDGHYTIKVDDTGQVKLTVAHKSYGVVHKIDSFYYEVK